MRVAVDTERCQGHGLCVMNAPAIFDFNDLGYATVNSAEVPEELVDVARRAASSCPERAITLAGD
jgi:ferredoxin